MKMKGLRWWVVSLVALATVINYIDRNALAVMWPAISDELGMDKWDYALIVNWLHGGVRNRADGVRQDIRRHRHTLGFRFGDRRLVDCGGIARRSAYPPSSSAWSGSPWVLQKRGTGRGPPRAMPSGSPIRERALAQGIFNSGASMGAVVSAPLVAFLYLAMGWKATFVLLGGLGFLWLVPWLILFKSGPESHPWLGADEREHILRGQRVPREDGEEALANTYAPGWFEMLKHRQSWSVISSRFFLDPVWWLFVSWLPLYLVDQFGFDIKQIGLFAWVPYVGAALGALFGGWVARQLMQRGWSVDRNAKGDHRPWGVTDVPGAPRHDVRFHPAFGGPADCCDPVRLPDRYRQHPDAAERLLFGCIGRIAGRSGGHGRGSRGDGHEFRHSRRYRDILGASVRHSVHCWCPSPCCRYGCWPGRSSR